MMRFSKMAQTNWKLLRRKGSLRFRESPKLIKLKKLKIWFSQRCHKPNLIWLNRNRPILWIFCIRRKMFLRALTQTFLMTSTLATWMLSKATLENQNQGAKITWTKMYSINKRLVLVSLTKGLLTLVDTKTSRSSRLWPSTRWEEVLAPPSTRCLIRKTWKSPRCHNHKL